jgi:hypothetical protein
VRDRGRVDVRGDTRVETWDGTRDAFTRRRTRAPASMTAPRTAATAPRAPVLALFGDTQGAARVIEWSASLALVLERELGIVHVESTAALTAASLPFTQVLEAAASGWAPFAPVDVELAYRAQAQRLRQLAQRAAQRHALTWTLRTMRGALPQLVFDAFAESDLLFIGPVPAPQFGARPGAAHGPKRRLQLAVASDTSAAGAQAVALAHRLAESLGAALHTVRIQPDGPASAAALRAAAEHADLLVLPRTLAAPGNLARLACPVLLVSTLASNQELAA